MYTVVVINAAVTNKYNGTKVCAYAIREIRTWSIEFPRGKFKIYPCKKKYVA